MKSSTSTNDRVIPPDKRKFERETAAITKKIKELEAKVVSWLLLHCTVYCVCMAICSIRVQACVVL